MLFRSSKGDSVSFGGNSKAGFRKTPLLILAAMFSVATHAQDIGAKQHVLPMNKVIQLLESWWSKFSLREQKIIQKVENEAARRYQQNGGKSIQKDSLEIIQILHINDKEKPLVKDLLAQYESDTTKGFSFNMANSPKLSPRKQELKEKATNEVTNYFFDAGKILRYSDENMEKVAQKIGATEEEVSFVKLVLKPQLDIYKDTKDPYSFFNQELLGDFK